MAGGSQAREAAVRFQEIGPCCAADQLGLLWAGRLIFRRMLGDFPEPARTRAQVHLLESPPPLLRLSVCPVLAGWPGVSPRGPE